MKKISAVFSILATIALIYAGAQFFEWWQRMHIKETYFRIASSEEIRVLLNTVGANGCTEFKDAYFDKDDPESLFMQATAYDNGVCIPQNLDQAAGLYKKAIEANTTDNANIIPFLKLALLYRYGAMHISETDYIFSLRQIALLLYGSNGEYAEIYLEKLKNEKSPILKDLKKSFSWLKAIKAKPAAERKVIAENLTTEGYKNTNIIWDAIEDHKPL